MEKKLIILYRVVREDLAHKVIFEQSPKGSEGMSYKYLVNSIYMYIGTITSNTS